MFGKKAKKNALGNAKHAEQPVKAKKERSRKPTSRGALWVIAALFVASGVLRLGDHGVAIAKEVASLVDPSNGPMTHDATCKTEDDIARVLAVLQEREDALNKREGALRDRLQAVSVAESQIQLNMAALVEAENSLKATMALADGAAENDLSQLTQVYESMKAKQAIPLFAQMDPQFAAGFLGRMRSESAAQIMAGLDPQKAYAISVILAGRNANVPTN
nr:hypothetical protein [Aliiroseovarius lamellibrachiae]